MVKITVRLRVSNKSVLSYNSFIEFFHVFLYKRFWSEKPLLHKTIDFKWVVLVRYMHESCGKVLFVHSELPPCMTRVLTMWMEDNFIQAYSKTVQKTAVTGQLGSCVMLNALRKRWPGCTCVWSQHVPEVRLGVSLQNVGFCVPVTILIGWCCCETRDSWPCNVKALGG